MKETHVNKREIIYFIIAAAVCILLYIIIGCPIKAFSGISCAGCGMTRALLAVGKGHVIEAFHYHPLFWCVPVCIIIYFYRNKMPKRLYNIFQVIAIVLFLVVYIWRIFDPGCEVVAVEIDKGWMYKLYQAFLKNLDMIK